MVEWAVIYRGADKQVVATVIEDAAGPDDAYQQLLARLFHPNEKRVEVLCLYRRDEGVTAKLLLDAAATTLWPPNEKGNGVTQRHKHVAVGLLMEWGDNDNDGDVRDLASLIAKALSLAEVAGLLRASSAAVEVVGEEDKKRVRRAIMALRSED